MPWIDTPHSSSETGTQLSCALCSRPQELWDSNVLVTESIVKKLHSNRHQTLENLLFQIQEHLTEACLIISISLWKICGFSIYFTYKDSSRDSADYDTFFLDRDSHYSFQRHLSFFTSFKGNKSSSAYLIRSFLLDIKEMRIAWCLIKHFIYSHQHSKHYQWLAMQSTSDFYVY